MKDALISNITEEVPEQGKIIQDLLRESIIPQGVEIPKPESVFSLGDATLFTKKSISTLVGKAKAGKTTATTWIVSQMLKQGLKVLWADTEQGEYYGSRSQFWVLANAGMPFCDDFVFFDLKIHRPEIRSEIIEAAIAEFKPDMVVIDGSRDLLYDINSTEQSLILSNDLMKWAAVYDCHILTILHLNKDGMNARGHIGTELINKSETVIKIDKNEDGLIVCSPEYCRDKDFTPFAFDRDDKGMPQIVNNFMGDITVSNSIGREPALMPNDPNLFDTHIQVVTKMFSQAEWLKYSEVIDQIQLYFGEHGIKFGEKKARLFIEYYRNNSYMVHDENQKGHAKWRSGLTQTKGILPNEDF